MGGDGAREDRGHQADEAQAEHLERGPAEIGVLDVGGGDALRGVLGAHVGDGSLGDERAAHAAHLLAERLGGVRELVASNETRVHGGVEGVEREGGAGGDGGVVPERGGVNALLEREGGDLGELHRPREVRVRVLLGVRSLEGADADVVRRGKGLLHERDVLVAHEELEVVERARADGVRHGGLDAALLDSHVDDL